MGGVEANGFEQHWERLTDEAAELLVRADAIGALTKYQSTIWAALLLPNTRAGDFLHRYFAVPKADLLQFLDKEYAGWSSTPDARPSETDDIAPDLKRLLAEAARRLRGPLAWQDILIAAIAEQVPNAVAQFLSSFSGGEWDGLTHAIAESHPVRTSATMHAKGPGITGKGTGTAGSVATAHFKASPASSSAEGKVGSVATAHFEASRASFSAEGKVDPVPSSVTEVTGDLKTGGSTVQGSLRDSKISDTPIVQVDAPCKVDELGRQQYAQRYVDLMTPLWREMNATGGNDHSFTSLLYAPWGEGKSTLLNLIEKEFSEVVESSTGKPWLVVKFNAWKSQHISPAWWPLLDRIYRDASQNQPRLKFFEYWWRFRRSPVPLLFFGVALLLLIAGGTMLMTSKESIELSVGVTGLGALVAVVTASQKLALGLLPGSVSAAENFVKMGTDPLQQVQKHFSQMLNRIDRPVIVFIDDLDRCREKYTVELLESIQTLFSNSRIFYLVAADRKWVSTCFELEYGELGKRVAANSHRSVGYLFVEKLFQLAFPLPAIPRETYQAYFSRLLLDDTHLQPLATGDVDIQEEVQSAPSAQERNRIVEAATGAERIRANLAHVSASTTEKTRSQTVHRLTRFRRLFGTNPRMAKLLITAFGMFEAQARISNVTPFGEDEQNQVVLWAILTLRFPRIAEYLQQFPEDLKTLTNDTPLADDRAPATESERLCVLGLSRQREAQDILRGNAGDKNIPELSIAFISQLNGMPLRKHP